MWVILTGDNGKEKQVSYFIFFKYSMLHIV